MGKKKKKSVTDVTLGAAGYIDRVYDGKIPAIAGRVFIVGQTASTYAPITGKSSLNDIFSRSVFSLAKKGSILFWVSVGNPSENKVSTFLVIPPPVGLGFSVTAVPYF
jgi:hypothetical protein